jgi:hypothetical protein
MSRFLYRNILQTGLLQISPQASKCALIHLNYLAGGIASMHTKSTANAEAAQAGGKQTKGTGAESEGGKSWDKK